MAGTMLDPKDLTAAIEFEQNRAAGISSHYAEHNLIPPPAVERAIEGATLNLDEVTEGDTRTAVRFLGPIRLATYAARARPSAWSRPGRWSTPTASG